MHSDDQQLAGIYNIVWIRTKWGKAFPSSHLLECLPRVSSLPQEVMEVLLGSGALVNTQNNAGCTPFFLATEGLHKTPSLVCGGGGGQIMRKGVYKPIF